jgi:pectate lyase
MRMIWIAFGVIAALGCSNSDDDSGNNDDGSGGSGFGSGGTYVPAAGSGGIAAGKGGSSTAGNGGSTASGSGSGGTSSQPGSGGTGGGMQNAGTGGETQHDSGVADSGMHGGSGGTIANTDAGPTQDSGTLVPNDELVGWASESGDGDDTTTGGQGGQEVTATSAQQLMDYASSADPLVIRISGTIAVPRVEVASNKTLIGVGNDATIEGGLRIRGKSTSEYVHNVIVSNLHVNGATSDVDGDAVQIHYAHHVWVDHCEIWDAADGNLDIVHASNWVTVSWTKFHYTSNAPDQNHRFCNLIGHSDSNASEDTGRLKVTFHHDWWADGAIERMPRVRFGQVHVFNSYYSAKGNNYAVGAALQARVVVENNVFDDVTHPHIFYDGETTAQMVAEGNLYVGASASNPSEGQQSGQGTAFDPPYDYTLDPANGVAAVVKANAGPR